MGGFRRPPTGPACGCLVSIPHSLYCETARFALDFAHVAYQEHAFCVGRHGRPVASLRTVEGGSTIESTGTFPGSVQGTRDPADARRTAVPLFISADGKCVLPDTAAILAHASALSGSRCDLQFFREQLDERLGSAARFLHYYFMAPERGELPEEQRLQVAARMWLATAGSWDWEPMRAPFRAFSEDLFKGLDAIFCLSSERTAALKARVYAPVYTHV